jgi:hypothetical protein
MQSREADGLLALIKKGSLENFAYRFVSGLTVLYLTAKVDKKTSKKAQKMLSDQQSGYAQNPRPSRQHKDRPTVKECWKDWQKNPALYPTETAFIIDMLEKTEIKRMNTIRDWIKGFTP